MKAALIGGAVLILLIVFRRLLGRVGRLAARSGLWLGFLWLFKIVSPLIGVSLGVNFFNAVVLGVLGALLLLIAICRPIRESLQRRFFL